ncbi:unnamed protein product [Phytomonas sp. EM1]|nr:unnamed protein product [Phytomonas sp. EM1]|eukprot:CCW62526.1 unnamed protein product [Phytomonas sp. isolate EM1]
MIVWKRRKEQPKPGEALDEAPGEIWVAFYALGCQLNLMLSAVRANGEDESDPHPKGGSRLESTASEADLNFRKGIQAHLELALVDACTYANQISDHLLLLYQQQSKLRTPYAILPIVLERVRSVFDEAAFFQQHRNDARGAKRREGAKTSSENLSAPLGGIQSNMEMNLLKLFSIFQRKVAQVTKDAPRLSSSTNPGDSGSPPNAEKVLQCAGEVDRQLVLSFAHIVYELLPTKVLPDNFLQLLFFFMEAFHRSFPERRQERCMLYYSHTTRLLQNALDRPTLEEAAQLLAQAVVMTSPDSPANNRHLLELKLIAVQLALGKALKPPSSELFEWGGNGVLTEVPASLVDAVEAVRTANLRKLEATMRENAVFYVETGIYNVMMVVRERVEFLMVMKFYLNECKRLRALSEGVENRVERLEVAAMVSFYNLPYRSVTDAVALWLLPLLLNQKVNGYVEGDYLFINPENPFEGYDKTLLETALEAY